MTKLDERISLELEQDLTALFEEDMACEVSRHDELPEYHEGCAEWYLVSAPCPHCGNVSEVVAACDRFKQILEESLHTSTVPCEVCKKRMVTADALLRVERIGK